MATVYPGPPKRRKLDGADAAMPQLESRTYTAQRILGKGSFGVVYQAQILETNEIVAIKSIHMQPKDREVQILKELKGHPNIVCLKGAFLSSEGEGSQKRLNLVLEFLSDTLHRVIKHYNVLGKPMDQYYVKIYTFQLVRGLAFVHGLGIVHTDIKPQNLLLDGKSQCLKICDFGTARRMAFAEQSRPYVCSRYYRAPELILGSTCYTTSVDIWSSGCVYAEMQLGQPIFTGTDGIKQLVEIIKVMGTPSPKELQAMNPNYPAHQFTPLVEAHRWSEVFRGWVGEDAADLAACFLRYDPSARLPPLQLLKHRYFDELRQEGCKHGQILFDFSEEELWWCTKDDRDKLVPQWAAALRPKAKA